jgi:hypothetical protein
MKAGLRIAAAIVVSLGVTVTLAAMQTHREFGHGAFCSRLGDEHVKEHTEHLRRWAAEELTLTGEQADALEPVVASLSTWASEMEPICGSDRANARDMIAATVQVADVTQRGVAEFAAAFDGWYATLNDEQRGIVDGWLTRDGHDGLHGG